MIPGIDRRGELRPSDLLRAFFFPAFAMFGAAAIVAIAYVATDFQSDRWLLLHLLLLGGVSQLVIGVGQFFTCAFLATTPPPKKLITAQVATWNAATIAVAIGVMAELDPLVDAGALGILAGLALFAAGLRDMQRRSLQTARWAVRWLFASTAALAIGAILGALLARGTQLDDANLLGAHLVLNVLGWLGGAIVGTLHTFFPSLTGTRLRFERLQGPTFFGWIGGVWILAAAALLGSDALAVLGWASLLLAGVLLATNLIASLRSQTIPLTAAARIVAFAQLFLPLGLTFALVATFRDGVSGPLELPARPWMLWVFVAGWVGLTVAGSLTHLVALLKHVKSIENRLRRPPA